MLVVFTIFEFKKNNEIDSILGFASTSWLILLFITIKYLPFPTIVLTVAFLLTIVALVVTYRKKLTAQTLVLGFSIILSLSFYFMPKDSRYYILNIRWNHEINQDYETWDKYSWHLYHNHKYE